MPKKRPPSFFHGVLKLELYCTLIYLDFHFNRNGLKRVSRTSVFIPNLNFSDQQYYVTRVISLVEEFMRMHSQVYFFFAVPRPPTLETLENLLKFPSMFVQALWPQNSPLLQLPHIQDNNIAFLRRKRIFTCADLAALDEHRRRNLLNTLEEQEYEDVITILGRMPKLEVESLIEGL